MARPSTKAYNTITDEIVEEVKKNYDSIGIKEQATKHNVDYNKLLKACKEKGIMPKKGPKKRVLASV